MTPETLRDAPIPSGPTLDDHARLQIKKWIRSTGITQTLFADQIGRNQAWLSRYLAGEIASADLETLQRMARVFDHSLASLLMLPSDPEEAAVIAGYRALPETMRRLFLKLLEEWAGHHRALPGRGPSKR